MNIIDNKIIDFIKEHHVLTLATSYSDEPYCCSCFYAYDEINNIFIFLSDDNTKHIKNILLQAKVAGTIHLETKIIGKIRGIQFTGISSKAKDDFIHVCRLTYFKKFPYAILNKSSFWIIKPDFIKYTDNRLGFGKKIIWENKNSILNNLVVDEKK